MTTRHESPVLDFFNIPDDEERVTLKKPSKSFEQETQYPEPPLLVVPSESQFKLTKPRYGAQPATNPVTPPPPVPYLNPKRKASSRSEDDWKLDQNRSDAAKRARKEEPLAVPEKRTTRKLPTSLLGG